MKCQRCKKNDASVHVKTIEGSQLRETHLCAACAASEDVPLAAPGSPLFDLLSLLAGKAAPAPAAPARGKRSTPCPGCGLRWSEFRESGRLGCPECYRAFEEPLREVLAKIHDRPRHAGRGPARWKERIRERELAGLREELGRAVKSEDFESAARLRDRIATLERP